MLATFLGTVFGLVSAGKFALLREYFELIREILTRPDPASQRLKLNAQVRRKEG